MPHGNAAMGDSSVVVGFRDSSNLDQERRSEGQMHIRAEAGTRARLDELERVLAFQLELKRSACPPSGIPAWTIGLATVVFLALLGVGVAFHLNVTASYQRRIVDLQATVGELEIKADAELGLAQAKLGQVTARAVSAERLVNELRGKLTGLEDKVYRLESVSPGRRARPNRGESRQTGAIHGTRPVTEGAPLGDAPPEGEHSSDCRDDSQCAMASRQSQCTSPGGPPRPS